MPPPNPRDMRVARLLMTLISLVVVSLGVSAIVTESHTGSTRTRGVVTLEGDDAVVMGIILVLLGLLPLALWFPTPRRATTFAVACVVAAGAVFFGTL